MNKNNDSLKQLFKYYFISRIILIIFLILAEFLLVNKPLGEYNHVFELFDNEHYLSIARDGYVYEYQYAFFPMIPFLIRYLGEIGFLIVNQIFVFLTGVLLYLISDRILGKKDKYYATLLYFISPISIFTCMFYSEGLFLFLTVLAFYLYKSKNNYLALGVTLGLAVLTRNLGSMLFFAIFVFMIIDWVKKKEKFKNILITYIPATIISCIYPIYLYIKMGDFLYFMNVQYIYWNRINTSIFTILFDVTKMLFNNPSLMFIIDYFITFGLIFYIFYYIFKHRRDKKYYELFLYIIFSLVAICSSIRSNEQALASFYRYIFGCFPIYFMVKKNFFTFELMMILSVFITIFFLVGYHFY